MSDVQLDAGQVVPAPADALKPPSKYTFVASDVGCLIQREGGLELLVCYLDTDIVVGGHELGIYGWETHLKAIAEWFTDHLLNRPSKRAERDAVEMISRALKWRWFEQWKRIVSEIVPPDVAKLARLMWASTQGDAAILHLPALYTDEGLHVRRDLEKYHAARMYARALDETSIPTDAYLDIMADWRGQLAPTVPNKALNKTLDRLPMGISWKDITRLSVMHLDNPLTDRLTVVFALVAADHHNWGLHERTVLSADKAKIIEAARVIGWPYLNARSKTGVIKDIARRILDFPERFGGDLVGLARRSEEWHARIDEYERYGLADEIALTTPQGVDLVALAEQGITLLTTASECYAEGETMRHCVGSYASKAAAGGCYLFHVEHEGETATVEVLPTGEVAQAYGPRNSRNQACGYGAQKLARAFMEAL